jgi:hypothetical protein
MQPPTQNTRRSPEILLRVIILPLTLESLLRRLLSIQLIIRFQLTLHLLLLLLRKTLFLLFLRTLSHEPPSKDAAFLGGGYTFSWRTAFSFRFSSFSQSSFSFAKSGNRSTRVLFNRLIISFVRFSICTFRTSFWRWKPTCPVAMPFCLCRFRQGV